MVCLLPHEREEDLAKDCRNQGEACGPGEGYVTKLGQDPKYDFEP